MKGANYVPTDIIFQSEDKKRLILQEAKLANFNMIRIWGGGYYESDQFIQLCDQLGLALYIDFQFANENYPISEDFL